MPKPTPDKGTKTAKCPNCNAILDPIPQRKTKCPSCGKDLYVRTNPFKGEKILTNYADALSIDAISNLGIKEKEYRAESKELAHKLNMATPFISDIVWGILSKRLLDSFERKDWQQAKSIYWQQAYLLYKQGKDYSRNLQEAARCDLQHYDSERLKKVKILAADSSCNKCKILDGRQITIKEALRTMPIPVKDCERGWCRCTYAPVIS